MIEAKQPKGKQPQKKAAAPRRPPQQVQQEPQDEQPLQQAPAARTATQPVQGQGGRVLVGRNLLLHIAALPPSLAVGNRPRRAGEVACRGGGTHAPRLGCRSTSVVVVRSARRRRAGGHKDGLGA